MFESFVTFTEVVKLSSNVFYFLREVNYSDKILDSIYEKTDPYSFEQIIDLIQDKTLIEKSVEMLEFWYFGLGEEKWLENIFKVIEYIDLKKSHSILLFYSSRYGILENIKYLIEKCESCNFIIEDGKKENALMDAASGNYLHVAEYLLEKGVNIHAKDDCALIFATENGYLEMIKFLADRGANIHTKDDYPLRIAAKKDYLDIVKYLVEKGANVNGEYESAIILAVEKGNLEIVKYLVKKGADIEDCYALTLAKMKDYSKIVKYLEKKIGNVNSRNYYDALITAIRKNDLEAMKYLVEIEKVDVRIRDNYALVCAALEGSLEAVKYLVENGASPFIQNYYSYRYIRPEITKYLEDPYQ